MISLVIPVYKNSENISSLLAELEGLNEDLPTKLEAIFVIDGSPDDCARQLRNALPEAGFQSQLLSLSRNFGAFSAIGAGLNAVSGEYCAVMAADLQEPPSLILDFYRHLESGECDVALGQRTGRNDPPMSKLSSAIFWSLYRRFILSEIPPGGVDIFGCNDKVRKQIVQLEESNSSLVGLLFWVGFRRTLVPYERRGREAGVSAWTLRKKVRYLSDSIFSFSDLPIQILLRTGVFGLLTSLVLSIVVLVSKFAGGIDVPGYAATILTVTTFGALNCFGLGLIGGYVWRTYENTKFRPGHIVDVHERFNSQHPGDNKPHE
jgi:polyisoprenyl-phosphate glycosyltransferase